MNIDISVIIPVYNDAIGIARCLEALNNQSLARHRFEIIVVDNASNDGTADSVRNFNDAILLHEDTPGSYAARNKGIQQAKGKYIAFTDADCIPESHWLEAGLERIQQTHTKCIIGGRMKVTISDKMRKPTLIENYGIANGWNQQASIDNLGLIVTANLFTERAAFYDIGRFDTKLLSGGDLEWSNRAKNSGYDLIYADHAAIHHPPRKTIKEIVNQARRVEGGRVWRARYLRDNIKRYPHLSRKHQARQATALESIRFLLNQRDFNLVERLSFLFIGVVIRGVSLLERIRLQIMGKPLR